MIIGEVAKDPLTPDDIISSWLWSEILEPTTVELADRFAALEVFFRLFQKVLILLNQINRGKMP